jgi:hypothetical protein
MMELRPGNFVSGVYRNRFRRDDGRGRFTMNSEYYGWRRLHGYGNSTPAPLTLNCAPSEQARFGLFVSTPAPTTTIRSPARFNPVAVKRAAQKFRVVSVDRRRFSVVPFFVA